MVSSTIYYQILIRPSVRPFVHPFIRLSCPDHTKFFVQFEPWDCWGWWCWEVDVGPPFFSHYDKLEVPMDVVWIGWCDQPPPSPNTFKLRRPINTRTGTLGMCVITLICSSLHTILHTYYQNIKVWECILLILFYFIYWGCYTKEWRGISIWYYFIQRASFLY